MPPATRPTPVLSPTPPSLATSAFAHARAVLDDTQAAAEAAILAVRRGGRSRPTVLAHARDAALDRAPALPVLDVSEPAPGDLATLARLLTFTRPAVERAVIDLASRHGLDQGDLGRALGVSPADGAATTTEVGEVWQRELDPVLLARLGPGPCPGMTEILGPSTPSDLVADHVDGAGTSAPLDEAAEPERSMTLGDLIDLGAAVGAHADHCEPCRDRLRAMVSVRTLVAQCPLEEPPRAVVDAAAGARLRASVEPPPLRKVRQLAARRWPLSAAVGVAVAAIAAGGFLAIDRDDDSSARVEALTKLPAAGTALAASPRVVDASRSATVRLRNTRTAVMQWDATPDQPWVVVTPASGSVAADGSGDAVISLAANAPEGDVRASVTFTGDDGSTAVVRVQSLIVHPPDIAASLAGCTVTAQIEDESELESAVLHWREALAERSGRMRDANPGTWARDLPATASSWWVTATDGLGNEGRTAEASLPSPAC